MDKCAIVVMAVVAGSELTVSLMFVAVTVAVLSTLVPGGMLLATVKSMVTVALPPPAASVPMLQLTV
jgi:hypothetical protein